MFYDEVHILRMMMMLIGMMMTLMMISVQQDKGVQREGNTALGTQRTYQGGVHAVGDVIVSLVRGVRSTPGNHGNGNRCLVAKRVGGCAEWEQLLYNLHFCRRQQRPDRQRSEQPQPPWQQ